MKAQQASRPDDLDAARDDVRAARFDAALARLRACAGQRGAPPEAALLLARVQLKTSPSAALATITRELRDVRARLPRAEAAILRGTAYARLGDPRAAKAAFDSAAELLRDGDPLHAELTYQIASAQWIERRLDAAARTLEALPGELDPDLALQARILAGAIASAREHLPQQGAILLAALRDARSGARPGVHPHAVLVAQIASLCVELPSAELRDAAIAEIAAVAWTPEIEGLHSDALRSVAWRHALDGDEFNAFRRLKDAMAATRSPAWRVSVLAERAYLAAALGERRWAAQELRDAHELAASVDWNAVDGEEKFALALLAELFAPRDAAVAIEYMSLFAEVGKRYARVLSSHRDRRVEALEAFARGRVLAALGQNDEAARLLEAAWKIYDRLGIGWRAGRAALALAEIGAGARWRERAVAALAPYPRSWLARALAPIPVAVAAAASPELAKLTPAQRAVFDLILDGKNTAQIAAALGRSTFTVRNHVKAIFKAFGVASRAALIVKSSRG